MKLEIVLDDAEILKVLAVEARESILRSVRDGWYGSGKLLQEKINAYVASLEMAETIQVASRELAAQIAREVVEETLRRKAKRIMKAAETMGQPTPSVETVTAILCLEGARDES